EKKLVKGFAFLSEKPMIYVENIDESQLDRLRHPTGASNLSPNTESAIICGKLEAEMAELPREEMQSFLGDYGLTESGAERFIRAEVCSYDDFKTHGSLQALKEKGLLRLEGKEYIVKDGDIMTIRHSG